MGTTGLTQVQSSKVLTRSNLSCLQPKELPNSLQLLKSEQHFCKEEPYFHTHDRKEMHLLLMSRRIMT